MASKIYLFAAFLAVLISSAAAHRFYVGGRKGWVVNPSQDYNHWAEKTRFQVNDSLVFKYKNGEDSVLVVNGFDYNNCNTKNPIVKFDDGNSTFKFERSGPFYFIGGHGDNCQKGQKLIVVVLAVRNNTPATPRSPPPPPHHAPAPGALPPYLSPAPGSQPPYLSPAPGSQPPYLSPAPGASPPNKSAASGVSRPSAVLLMILFGITISKFGLV